MLLARAIAGFAFLFAMVATAYFGAAGTLRDGRGWAMLAVFFGCAGAIDFPAQQAFLGDLAGISEIRKAVVVNASVFQTSRILGPALAGIVVGTLGAATAFWLNGMSFVAVIVSLIVVRAQQVGALQREARVRGQLLDVLDRRQLPTGEDLLADELHELKVADRQLDVVLTEELLGVRQDGVQQHPAAVGRQDLVGPLEEDRVPLGLERLEGADRDNPEG